jgi:N-acetylglucosamine-6-sulfatase
VLAALVAGVSVVAPSLLRSAEVHRRATAPNIVVIVTDDQRFDTLWAMPNVRADLVHEGVNFTNAFVVNPTCCPSRASILTGLYSHSTGVYAIKGPHGGFAAFDPSSTIATWLHDAGYRTALIGKYLNGYGGTGIPPGWDEFDAFQEQPETGLYYDYSMNLSGVEQSFGTSRADYSTNVLGDLATTFISSSSDPFFLYLAPRAPHAPATPAVRDRRAFRDLAPFRPPSYDEAHVADKPRWLRHLPRLSHRRKRQIDAFRVRQYRSLLAVDRMVGDIVDQLDEEGRLDTTMIVLMSDNGMMWGEHRLSGKGVPYEESIRVPMVIRYDPLVTPHPDGHLVLNIDVAPTLAAIAGVSPSTAVEGADLSPLLDSSATAWRNHFLIEHLGRAPPTFCAIRGKRFTYVAYRTGEEELFDLRTDPWELRSDPAGHPARRRALLAWLQELCDPPPPGYTPPTG